MIEKNFQLPKICKIKTDNLFLFQRKNVKMTGINYEIVTSTH